MTRAAVVGWLVLVVILGGTAAAAGAAEVPVVVAVDVSRSLSAPELAAVGERLTPALGDLGPAVPLGLLAFADTASWVVPPGGEADRVIAGLAELRPEGTITVLHDALVIAARALPEGGVVVVVTDGRDESSATTAEDVARTAIANDVRIVTISHGARIDERALRRLGLLTGGSALGSLAATSPATIVSAIGEARMAVAEDAAARRPTPVPTPAPAAVQVAAQVTVPEAGATAAPALPWWLLPTLAVLLLAAIVVTVVVVLRRRRASAAEERVCERCGALLEPWEVNCGRCAMAQIEDAAEQPVASKPKVEEAPESILDAAVFQTAPIPPGLDQTMVLDEQATLLVRGRGTSKSYVLPDDQVFAVGRAPEVNTLKIDDPSVSAQHFKVVPKDREYYIVDLETTNGTTVNDRRIRLHKLASGDIIRAGTSTFEFRITLRRQG